MTVRAAALALALTTPLAARAADRVEVRLRSGRVLSAQSAERVGDVVVVRMDGSILRLASSDVAAIVAAPARRAAGLNLAPAESGNGAPASETIRAKGPEASLDAKAAPSSIDDLRAALVERPDDAFLRLALGKALVSAGQLTQALAELSRIGDDAPRAVRLERALAASHALTRLDRPAEAVTLLDAALADAGTDASLAARLQEARESAARDAASRRAPIASEHFRVHVPEGLDAFAARPLLDLLEQAHQAIASALGSAPTEPIVVLLLPGDDFWETTGQGRNVSGLFDGKVRVPAGRVSPPSSRLAAVLRHEVTHAFVHVISQGRASAWWHEGLAEHFEGEGIAPTLRSLEQRARDSAASWPPPLTHEVAHARMEWLLSSRGMPVVSDILRGLATSSEEQAVRRATGRGVAELDDEWRRALASRRT